jgi:paraquat-inducible protein A
MTTIEGPKPLTPPTRDPALAVEVMACHECGLLHWLPPMREQQVAVCTACGATLGQRVHRGIDRALACYMGALVLFYVANAYPIMSMTIEGRTQSTTIIAGSQALWDAGIPALSMVVLLAGTLLPLFKILGNLYVLAPLRLNRSPAGLGAVFRLIMRIQPWAMMEVYLLGLIVAYVKLGDLADLHLGIAAVAFVVLILVMIAGDANLEAQEVWGRIAPQAGAEVLRPRPGTTLIGCHTCNQLLRLPSEEAEHGNCPRCGAHLHRRKPDSLARAWALMIAAVILYIPANLYPVMTVIYLGQGDPSTIMGGVIMLLHEGMVPVALLVFFASVVVPVLKIAGLAFLLVSVQKRSTWRPRQRTVLYRVIEGVGRWSMVDVFMIAILTALVKLGALASIEPGHGAVAFSGVVILTMVAAMSFDPKLIWDVIDERAGGQAQARA